MEVSKSSRRVLGFSLSQFSSLMRFQDLSQNYICSRLMKLSFPIESLRQIEFILFSCKLRLFLRQIRIQLKVTTLSLWISYIDLDYPFFFISFRSFFTWLLLIRGKCSCLKSYKSWMNSISLDRRRTVRPTISSLIASSMGMPLYFFSPTVEMYLRGSMLEGQMQLRKPPKSIFSLYPYSPKRTLRCSSEWGRLFSWRRARKDLLERTPSARAMQLNRASGWKSVRVVRASRQAWRVFS